MLLLSSFFAYATYYYYYSENTVLMIQFSVDIILVLYYQFINVYPIECCRIFQFILSLFFFVYNMLWKIVYNYFLAFLPYQCN